MFRTAKYQPRRVNNFVPGMQFSEAIIHSSPYEVIFGPAAAASATNILNAQSISAGGSTTTFVQDNTDGAAATDSFGGSYPYGPGFGRNLQYVASGASTATVTVNGRDYLGQPMTEQVTLNGATPVNGKKAFKYIDKITWTAGGAVTMNVGTNTGFGLPYKSENVLGEMSNHARVATLGTLTAPDTTDPQTATTGDTRGTYVPNTTPDGAKILSAIFILDTSKNAAGNGGLHGVAHFY